MNQNPIPTSIEVFSLDADIKINELKKLPSLTLNETKRMFLAVINAQGQPDIAIANYFYDPVSKTSFTVPANPKLAKDCVDKFGSPKIKFGTIVGVYPTDNYGNVTPGFNPQQIQLYAFTFSSDKFPMLKQLNSEWGLASHDILCTCDDAQFQKWRIIACKESLYISDEATANEIRDKARSAFGEIKKFLPKTLSEQEVMIKLGQLAPQMPMVQQSPFAPQVGVQPQQMIAPPSMPQQPMPQQNMAQPQQFMTPPLQPVMPQTPDFRDFVAQPSK